MQFAKITNGRVEKILAGSNLPEGYTVIPNNHQLQVGDDVRFFDREYKRKSETVCVSEGLITVGENETAQWENGGYVVKPDYREVKYWKKETGEPVQFQIGDEPDESMTDIDPEDGEALWDEKTGWYVPDEVKARRARERRDELLEECDYIMLWDYPIGDEERKRWVKYRQALRDVPQQKGFPGSVQWPSKPGGAEVVK